MKLSCPACNAEFTLDMLTNQHEARESLVTTPYHFLEKLEADA